MASTYPDPPGGVAVVLTLQAVEVWETGTLVLVRLLNTHGEVPVQTERGDPCK